MIFLHHLAHLPPKSLARKFHDVQKNLQYDGVVTNCYKMLEEWNFDSPLNYTKSQWKRKVKIQIDQVNKNKLISMMKNYKKLNYREYEERPFQMSSYFKNLNIEDSRMMIKIKLKMIPTIRDHFKSNKKYKAENHQCPDCIEIGIVQTKDSMEHVLTSSCEANEDLREGKDFSKDEQICQFFHQLIQGRIERFGC